MDYFKIITAVVALVLTLWAYLPFIYGILYRGLCPHVFTWLIWALTTIIVGLAQLQAAGGLGAGVILVSGCLTAIVFALAFYKRAQLTIYFSDWVFLLMALAALPFWFATSALVAVIILTAVDVLGFMPTLRKAYVAPHSESLGFYVLFLVRNLLVIAALDSYSLTTYLFPLAISLACVLMLALLLLRRRQVLLR